MLDPTWPSTAEEPYDPPLSADGVEQARRLGRRLAPEGIQSIVSSPFLRAIQTAHHINEALGAPIFLEPGFGEWLTERSFERLPRLQALEVLRAQYPALRDGYPAAGVFQYPESAGQLRARTKHALEALLDKLEGTLLVVGHAASVAAMGLVDERVERIECPLCALFCLEHDGSGWRLAINAEVTHVGERMACFTFP